jgi:hypothetical protein
MLAYIEAGRLRKLGWAGEGRGGKPLDEQSYSFDYETLEDVGLGGKGFVVARRVDGRAEIVEMMEGGLEVVHTFTATVSRHRPAPSMITRVSNCVSPLYQSRSRHQRSSLATPTQMETPSSVKPPGRQT